MDLSEVFKVIQFALSLGLPALIVIVGIKNTTSNLKEKFDSLQKTLSDGLFEIKKELKETDSKVIATEKTIAVQEYRIVTIEKNQKEIENRVKEIERACSKHKKQLTGS